MSTNLLPLFAPLVYLYSEDALRPCSANWMLERSALLRPSALNNVPSSADFVLKKGAVNAKTLITQESEGHYSGWAPALAGPTEFTLYLPDLKIDGFSPNHPPSGSPALGEPLVNMECKAACYGYVKENLNTIDLLYMFCYALNGATSSLPYAGVHVGDWEHIVVRVDKTTHILQQVYFARHSFSDGKWYSPTEIELQDSRIVAYSAAYSHASYPHAGNWPNPSVGPLAPDKCDRGPQWKTWENLVDVGTLEAPNAGCEWLQFNGRWGGKNYDWSSLQIGVGDGPRSPSYHEWWTKEPST
ncbi:MAG: Vps62-related protein [Bacteroidota bacterium]